MDNKNAKHNKILSDRKEQFLKRNIELTSDSDEDIDIQQELYRKHADEVESVLNEIGVGGTRKDVSSDNPITEKAENAYKDSNSYDEGDSRDEYDVDDIADEDDYLEEDGLFDLFPFGKKKKKQSSQKRKKPLKEQEGNPVINEEKDEQAPNVTEQEYHTEEMLNQEELLELESAIESGEYEEKPSDNPNAGIYESFGGMSADEEYDADSDTEEPQETDSERLFRQKILNEKMPEPSKLSSNVKWLIAFGVLLVIFIVLTAFYLSNLSKLKYGEMDINPIYEDELIVNDGVEEKVQGYRTIVLYGVDSRESNLAQGTNSDSIIIVSINEDTKEIKLVSVYRDTLLEIQSEGIGTHKVNYAYQLGGAVTAVNTLNTNLDLYITDYVAVDFNALADIIDAVGGVEIEIEDKEINNLNKNLAEQIRLSGVFSDGIYEAGKQTLNGQQAVAYSRIRSTDMGDITRTERQRKVLLQIVDKLVNADGEMIDSLIDVSFSCISTSITKDEAVSLAKDLRKYKVTDSAGFPFAYSGINLNGKGSVLVASDLSGNVAVLHQYLYGDASYAPSAAVEKISSEITSETGVAATDVNIPKDDGNTDSDKSGDEVNTMKEPPEGMILDE